MKKPILILISLLLLTGVSESKEVSYLHERNGIKYEVNSEIPYTGSYIDHPESGRRRTSYVDGKPKGLFTTWFKNGHRQKEYEGYLNNRNREGLWTYWYKKNGQKKFEGNLIDGKKEGLCTWWDKEGNVTETEIYKDDELVD